MVPPCSPLGPGHCALSALTAALAGLGSNSVLWAFHCHVGFGDDGQPWADAVRFPSRLSSSLTETQFPFCDPLEVAESSDTNKGGPAQHCTLGSGARGYAV